METIEKTIGLWQVETDGVKAEDYAAYMADGDTRGLGPLVRLEDGFERVLREIRETDVADAPAVWAMYNMGCVVKTGESLFSIDLVHRRALELAPLLDFALITHNHADHWRQDFYQAMNGAGKTVVSNFLDNYGAADWRKGGPDWMQGGGYCGGERTMRIRDVEIHASRLDHNDYLKDFTTAFEIRCGGWTMYHTGDCGKGSEGKLATIRGRPDLWFFFPGCGIDVAQAVLRVMPKKLVFGHLWELGHKTGRLTEPLILNALEAARGAGCDPSLALWGTRVF